MSTTRPARLLVVDDEPDLRTLYELTLLREGHDVDTAACVDDALALLQQKAYDAIITDMRLPDGSGLDVLRHLEQGQRPEKVVVITAHGSAENAVEALKAGAFDYLTKPVDLKQFRSVVASAVAARGTAAHSLRSLADMGQRPARPTRPSVATHEAEAAPCAPLPQAASTTPPSPAKGTPLASQAAMSRLIGHSQAIEQVRALIEKVSRSMAPVLLWGESGTGKELVARAIHDVSARRGGPFVAVNCGAIPEHLLEAEFFGYRKGAFTGAQEDRDGFFQAARGGTLFLDEIGDLPLSMQSKLLRAIQERAVRPVGAVNELAVDVRIVSASHKDLAEEVREQRFRQDLFYRLNVILIALPPLRHRLDDLPLICEQVLQRIAQESGLPQPPRLAPSAVQALTRHAFPGNVRELENLLHRAVALSAGHSIEAEDLGLPELSSNPAATHQAAPNAPAAGPEAMRGEPSSDTPWPATGTVPVPADLVAHLDHIERDILVQALEQHRLNRTAAGAAMGLSLRQMRYRMARLGVQIGSQGVVIGERFMADADPEGME